MDSFGLEEDTRVDILILLLEYDWYAYLWFGDLVNMLLLPLVCFFKEHANHEFVEKFGDTSTCLYLKETLQPWIKCLILYQLDCIL